MECDVPQSHVDSFNYLVDEGLKRAIADVQPERFRLHNGEAVQIWSTSASLGYPSLEEASGGGSQARLSLANELRLWPSECRQRGLSYSAKLQLTFCLSINGRPMEAMQTVIGQVPIMLCSKRCHLTGLTGRQLVGRGEEATETGGYFVVHGNEKVVRTLVVPRRNYPMAMVRERYRGRGLLFSPFAVTMRCVRANHSAAMLMLHYLECSSMQLYFTHVREGFFVPLVYVLRALVDATDAQLFDALMLGREHDAVWSQCVVSMLRAAVADRIVDMAAARRQMGGAFRPGLGDAAAPWQSDEEIGEYVLKSCIMIQHPNCIDKFHALVFMAQKLIALKQGEIQDESPDNPQFQEAALSGFLMLMLIKDRVEMWMNKVRRALDAIARRKGDEFVLTPSVVDSVVSGGVRSDFTRSLEMFLATGNLTSRGGMALQQQTGYSIVAERINHLRFVSHFRSIHRGSFFQEMRTTDVRKLRPEAWGFICPVHTPDGSPCGLLNHLTASCRVSTAQPDVTALVAYMRQMGMVDLQLAPTVFEKGVSAERVYAVLVDGLPVGFLREECAAEVEDQLRFVKLDPSDCRLSPFAEIVRVPLKPVGRQLRTQLPAIYIFTEGGRLMRPVKNLVYDAVELIGTFEQVYLHICIEKDDLERGVTMHQELQPNSLFSFAANLIPFPDHNQSPRNVYQCQMGKQTMGVPIHALHNRSDNKMYKLLYPQSAIVKPQSYDAYGLNEYPMGTNAVVAVTSYTGYDMEDSMTVSKQSYERGYGHGSVYKNERVDLRDRSEQFERDPKCNARLHGFVDADGLPVVGRLYKEDDPYYCAYDPASDKYMFKKFKASECAFVQSVRVLGDMAASGKLNHALIQWRIQRNPIIGDKFASRHGQKGILSLLYPTHDMPFSSNGLAPDVIFNPHGFPSRMTIGMLIESMAAKVGAALGWTPDATPFVFNEQRTAIGHFGDLSAKVGFNYQGYEMMFSGIDGRPFDSLIFIGVVYYQRLRHMVADKFQVRATGPTDPVTMQPVKGRKRHGGVRFGEMERDAIIAHGGAYLLNERLVNSSDKGVVELCTRCRSILSVRRLVDASAAADAGRQDARCATCGGSDCVRPLEVPLAFRYLAIEFAAMGVKLAFDFKQLDAS